MAAAQKTAERPPLEQLMGAVLAMLIAEREDRLALHEGKSPGDLRKTEVILSSVGLSYQQIAALLDKKADTVQKTVSRAKLKSARNGEGTGG